MVIASEPGFYTVDWQLDPEDRSPISPKLEPVIAWLVSIYEGRGQETVTVANPITHEPRGSLYEGAILYPDGRVVISGKTGFLTLDAYNQSKLATFHNNATTLASKCEELGSGGLRREAERVSLVKGERDAAERR
jgi:hypothetical protein